MEIINRQPKAEGAEFVYLYNPRSVGAAFTRACKVLEISDLHFHDLRHEGTRRRLRQRAGSRGWLGQGEGGTMNDVLPRTALLVIPVLMAGCAASSRVETMQVRVAVPVACTEPEPTRPSMPTESLRPVATVDDFTRAALAEIERREGYEILLRTALDNCRKLIGASDAP